jgi:prepilin-type N-terminal cleavage/methylation domain-containing protein
MDRSSREDIGRKLKPCTLPNIVAKCILRGFYLAQVLALPCRVGRACDEARQQAFTLIELSVVLVIIGLIVGGVLVGQGLIRAAGVRATITQIEKYNQAVNAFRGKYGYPCPLNQ